MKLQVSITVFSPLFLLAIVLLSQSSVSAAEPAWYPYVVARGVDRIAIQNTPMHQRPYRPMHIYGNAVRRGYYRGNTVPFSRSANIAPLAPLFPNAVPLTRNIARTMGNTLLRR